MGDVVGIVLGAGSSRRLGRPKQTLPFGDRSLLAHVVREAEDSCVDRVIVVLGGGGAAAQLSLAPGRAWVVRNDAYSTGCSSSMQVGLDAAGACDAIVLLLGDMPGVDADVIDDLVDGWSEDPTWAAVASYRDEIGHPFLFSVGAFATLRSLHGDKAIWKIVDREPEDRVARIPIDRLRPDDIDTWDDYLRACQEFGFAPAPPLA